jgi:hypothetical protein
MTTIRRLLAILSLTALTGCAASTGASPSPSPSFSIVSPSPSASPSGGSASASPAPSDAGETVDSPEEAAERVKEEHPEFAGIGPMDPNIIGACCWWEATATDDGYRVEITVGWGDCPSGCIDRHVWIFEVSREGDVELIGEQGPSVPPEALPG